MCYIAATTYRGMFQTIVCVINSNTFKGWFTDILGCTSIIPQNMRKKEKYTTNHFGEHKNKIQFEETVTEQCIIIQISNVVTMRRVEHCYYSYERYFYRYFYIEVFFFFFFICFNCFSFFHGLVKILHGSSHGSFTNKLQTAQSKVTNMNTPCEDNHTDRNTINSLSKQKCTGTIKTCYLLLKNPEQYIIICKTTVAVQKNCLG